jgi:hypothetical protein
MGAIDELLTSTKKEGVSIKSSRTEQATPRGSGGAIDELLSQTKQKTRTSQVQSTVGIKPVAEPKKGFFALAVDAGANVIKFGLDAFNASQQKIAVRSFGLNELTRGNIIKKTDPLTGKSTLTTDRLLKYKAAKTPEEKAMILSESQAEAPLVKILNSSGGKAVIKGVSGATSNLPLKTMAAFQAIGDKTYDQAYSAWLSERNDPANPTWKKFLYELQDSAPQSAIGVLLALGTSAATRSPNAGFAVSGAYYSALSADEQLQERGKVDSLGNIAIDTIGDEMLGKLLIGVLGKGKGAISTTLKGMGVEGSTEVTQSLLKYANDYGNAGTEKQKQTVLDSAKKYITSGEMLMEFGVGAVSGGIIGGATSAIDALLNPSIQPKKKTATPPEKDDSNDGILKEPSTIPISAEVTTDITKARNELTALERTADVNDDQTAGIVANLRDTLNDYTTAFNDKTVYVPSEKTNAPLIEITTSTFPDGKVAVKFSANTETNGFSSAYDFTQLFDSKESATKNAKRAIIAWAQSQETTDPQEKAQYEKIVDYTQNPRAPIAKEAKAQSGLETKKKGTKKYPTIHEGGVIKMVEGEPVKIVDGIETFLHEGDGGWVISEATTGRVVAESRSREGVIAKAGFTIDDVGVEKYKKLITDNKLRKNETAKKEKSGSKALEYRSANSDLIAGKMTDAQAKEIFAKNKKDLEPITGKYDFSTVEEAEAFLRSKIGEKLYSKVLDSDFYVNELTIEHFFGERRKESDKLRRAKLLGPGLEIIEDKGILAAIDDVTDKEKGIVYYDILGKSPEGENIIIRAKLSEANKNGKVYFTVSDISGGAPVPATPSSGRRPGRLTASEIDKSSIPQATKESKLPSKMPEKSNGGRKFGQVHPRTPEGEIWGPAPEKEGAPLPKVMGNIDQINPIELPELVDIAREIMGRVPEVSKRTGKALGFFKPNPLEPKITILASLFEEDKLPMVTKVLAHEVGHLTDFLPEKTMKRGNLLGRLFTLRSFMSETFNPDTEKSFTAKDRAKVRQEVEEEVMDELGFLTKKEMLADEKAKALIKERNKEAVKVALEKGGFIKDETIRKELLAVTRYWSPYDPAKVKASYRTYRESSVELYAEAISMLFNAPNRLRDMAPTFYERYFAALDAKPSVRNVYFEIQALLSGDRELITKRRREGVRTMFKEGDYKAIDLHNRRAAEKEERRKNYWEHFKHTMIDKNFQIIDRVKAAKRAGKTINPDEDPTYFLEERNYIGGKIKAVFDREFGKIYDTVNKNGIAWEDFGEMLFYMRIAAGDRSDVANPRGITPEAAKELAEKVTEIYDAKQREIFAAQIEKFHKAVQKINEEAFEAGLYKPELYKNMMENPAYVSFQVLDHLEDGMTSRVYKSLGTLKDIANPADATMLKVISTIRAAERNKTSKATVDFLLKEFRGEIEEAKYTGSKKGRFPVPSRDPNKKLITYFEKGTIKGYYVDPYIADSINNESIGHNAPIVPVIRFMNKVWFRPVFISFNLGFQSFNLIRDFVRFYKNVPDMTFLRAMKRYGQAGRIAKIRAFGLPENPTGKDLEAANLLNRLEEEKVLSVTFNDLINGETDFDKQVEKILADTGIKDFQPKPLVERSVEKIRPKFVRPVITGAHTALEKTGVLKATGSILGTIEKLGNLIETLPKAAGVFEYTSKNENGWLSKDQKSFIRRKIGSPDFLAGGTYKPITNEVFLFSNAIIQGIRSDVEVASDPVTRSGFWWKTTRVVFLPKILMMAVLLGFFGDEYKELMEGASEYDKTNYTIVPLGKDTNGKPIYTRVPVDETSRFLGGIFWKLLTLSSGDRNVAQDVMDIASYTGGQIPSISPAIESFSAASQFLSGQNPYDYFRGKNVISDTTFKAGGLPAAQSYLGWQFQQLGGGIFYKFYHEPTIPKEQGVAERVFNLPVFGNIAGRFVRVSDYGQVEKLNAVEKKAEQKKARETLLERELISKYVKEAQDKKIRFNTSSLENSMVKERYNGMPKNKTDAEDARRLVKKFRISLRRGSADANTISLIDASSNAAKLEILKTIRLEMDAKEFSSLRNELLRGKIVSQDVFNKLRNE